MLLSDILKLVPDLILLKDGKFNELGLTATSFADKLGLTFLTNKEYLNELKKNDGISCVICNQENAEELSAYGLGVCVSNDPKRAFFSLHNHLLKTTDFYGKKTENDIDRTAEIHPSAFIDDFNVKIARNVIIEPNVVVRSNVSIGENVILRAGCVIGGDGFQAFSVNGRCIMVKSAGSVEIKEHVEICNNSCVDKGVFKGKTIIGEDTKIDNLVHIAHDVIIGRNCLITGNALIAGRVVIEDNVWIGVSSVVSNGLRIGANAKVSLGAIVTRSVASEQTVTGNFAIDHEKYLQFLRTIR